MNTKRCMITTVLAAALVVSMDGTAFAAYNIMLSDPYTQPIGVGTTATYTITVHTDAGGNHNITYNTKESLLYAKLTGPTGGDADGITHNTTMGVTGSILWNASSSAYVFTYEVCPQTGITCGDYPMEITDIGTGVGGTGTTIVTATTTPSGSVVPESPTFALVSIGLVGMVALGRRKKR